MNYELILKPEEKAAFKLRDLYTTYGYSRFKMRKFEEYDLYVNNKDFLISENVITFTENGKLMALKPDVTLSIIKNAKNISGVEKVYYNENVYRIPKGSDEFKEIMQAGLECFGDVSENDVAEVITLAAKSLMRISNDWVLDISDLKLVSAVLSDCGVSESGKIKILRLLGEKNIHGIKSVIKEENISESSSAPIISLVTTCKSIDDITEKLSYFAVSERTIGCVTELKTLLSRLTDIDKSRVRVDFSVVNDMNYYNGMVFKGFINRIPTGVLSGGQYDGLMKKMGKDKKAIGFAVYLDLLERLDERQ